MPDKRYLGSNFFKLVGIVAVFIVIYLSYRSHFTFRESIISQTQQQLLTIAKTTARSIEDAIFLPSGVLETVARDTLLQRKVSGILKLSEEKALYSPLEVFLMIYSRNLKTLFLLDEKGNIVQSHGATAYLNTSLQHNNLDSQGVALVLKEKKANVGSAFFNPHGDLTFSVSEPVFNNRELIGVTQRVINLSGLSKRLIEPIRLYGRTRAWMFDDRDVIVSHPKSEFVGLTVKDIIAKEHEKQQEHFHVNELQAHIQRSHGYIDRVRVEKEGGGLFVSCAINGNELVSFKRVKVLSRQWGLVVALPYKVIGGPIAEHAQKVFGLAFFIICLFFAGGLQLINVRKRKALLEADAKYLKPLAASAEALRNGEKRFRDLVENSLVGILILQDGLVAYQNPEQERLFGILPKRFNFSDFENFHPEDAEKFKHFYHDVLFGKKQVSDLEVRFYPLEQVEGSPVVMWVLCRGNLIDFEGREAVLVNMVDITRAKELEHLVMTKQKMVSLGHVAAGIAHEIRNPLSGMNIHISTLKRLLAEADGLELSVQSKTDKILRQLFSASGRIEMVIRKVMDFSKPGHPKLVKININESLKKAIDLSTVTLKKSGIKLEHVFSPWLPNCKADGHLIEQVILNLITNGAQAMERMIGNKKIVVFSSFENGNVIVRVADSGPGVPGKIEQMIFDPFFTTKSDSSGIGLSLCHRIITDHKGTLKVGKSQWGGAEFTITLPV